MHRSVKRLLATGFAAAGLAAGLATAASAAPAAASTAPAAASHATLAKVSQLPTRITHPDSYGHWQCYAWNLGSACIDAYSNGYDAAYWNTSGAWQYVDFTLQPSGVGDQGAFWAAPGSWHTYFFATGNLGAQRVGVYFRNTGQFIYSPLDRP